MNFELSPYSLKLTSPLRFGKHTLKTREGVWLKGEGGGLGDLCPLPGFSVESLDEALEALEGHSGEAPQALPASVDWALHCAGLAPLSQGVFEGVKSAELLQSLSLDLKKESVVKLKVGRHDLADEVRWIKALSPRFERIRLDGNRSLDVEKTLALSEAVGEQLEFFEEPTPRSMLSQLYDRVPIALDESLLQTLPEEISEQGCPLMKKAKALVLKPSLLGSTRLAKLIDFGISESIEVIFSSLYESEVGHAHLRRLAHTFAPKAHHGLGTRSAIEKGWPT